MKRPTFALIAAVLIVYGWSLTGDFIWDDRTDIVDAATIKQRLPNFWPLSYGLFWAEWRLLGTQTSGYHVHPVNVVAAAWIFQQKTLLALFVGSLQCCCFSGSGRGSRLLRTLRVCLPAARADFERALSLEDSAMTHDNLGFLLETTGGRAGSVRPSRPARPDAYSGR